LFPSTPLTPAQKLVGQKLPQDWTVVSMVTKAPNATGGHFSIGYIVKHKSGREAFLKAIDFSRAFSTPDPSRALQELTETFNFERDLLNKCRNKNLDRVVRAIEDGNITIDGVSVPYLIFELAGGDIRSHMDLSVKLDLAWTLRMLHQVAVGLQQLHGVGIAHPDYKPPHEDFIIAGAYPYSPPELRYGFTHSDFNQRRFGCDAYLLGNIILFALTRLTVPTVMYSFIAPQHMPNVWTGTYEQVLPYLQKAFNDALQVVEPQIPQEVRTDILLMLRYLCEPDLAKRGHPKNCSSTGNNFSLERFITKLNVLAYKAERNLF